MTDAVLVADAQGAQAVPEEVKDHWDWLDWFFETSGAAAIGRLRLIRPTLAFVNLQMPDMPGIELIERIRKGRRNLPLIVTSDQAGWLPEKVARTLGVVAYLNKPLQPMLVDQVLASVLIRLGRSAGRPVGTDTIGGE